MPVHDSANERRDELDTGLSTGNGLSEGEEQSKVAVDPFLLQLFSCPNALPSGGDLDENTITIDAVLFIAPDQ